MSKILVVEDNEILRNAISQAFLEDGHEVDRASNGEVAIKKIVKDIFDVVITDMKMGKVDGMEVLREAKKRNPSTSVIIITAYGTIDLAVKAIKEGGFDFVQKPFDIEELGIKLNKALEVQRLLNEVKYLRHEQGLIYDFDNIIGESPQMKKIFSTLKKVAKSNTTVLISGETGTGKEVIAGAIHYNSLCADKNFIKVNCAALQENLLESELFGHERGAFTGADKQRVGRFEQAHRGTLFLDEIADMSPSTQAKILRVLQEKEFERLGGTKTIKVDVRLIAASNKDLIREIDKGNFREDLFYRLNVVNIKIPPLRERKDDIIPLAKFFLQRFSNDLKKDIQEFKPEAIRLMNDYNWPGNIREMENAIERAVLMTENDTISVNDLSLNDRPSPVGKLEEFIKLPAAGVNLAEVEKSLIIQSLKMSNWVQKDAAKLLGISKRVIHYKIHSYGITNSKWGKNVDKDR